MKLHRRRGNWRIIKLAGIVIILMQGHYIMKIFSLFLIIIFCVLSSTLFVRGQNSENINLTDSIKIPSKKRNGCYWKSSSIIEREKPSDLAGLIVYGFRGLFGKNDSYTAHYNCPPLINYVLLDRTEVIIDKNILSAQSNSKNINITVSGTDPENDVFSYIYKVSNGNIIGTGSNVIWNLSGAKPGKHSVTVCLDDGLGCDLKDAKNKLTKEVLVTECSDCKK
jgi:hypothetical protein